MTKAIKKYLLSRTDEVTAWIGFLGFILEIVLHSSPSYIMLALFICLFALPDKHFSDMFGAWDKKLNDLNQP